MIPGDLGIHHGGNPCVRSFSVKRDACRRCQVRPVLGPQTAVVEGCSYIVFCVQYGTCAEGGNVLTIAVGPCLAALGGIGDVDDPVGFTFGLECDRAFAARHGLETRNHPTLCKRLQYC